MCVLGNDRMYYTKHIPVDGRRTGRRIYHALLQVCIIMKCYFSGRIVACRNYMVITPKYLKQLLAHIILTIPYPGLIFLLKEFEHIVITYSTNQSRGGD